MSGTAIIKLSNGRGQTIIDASDYEWACKIRWHLSTGRTSKGYACGRLPGGERVKLHRMVLRAKPGDIGDHINGDTLDNRSENLRICSFAENNRNSDSRRPLPYGYKGVSKFTEVVYVTKYRAIFRANGKRLIGPLRETPEQAAIDYDNFAIQHHGPFAFINFPDGIMSESARGNALSLIRASEGAF